MIHKIAFVGATGMIGKPVASALANAGFDVTALVRSSGRSTGSLLPNNIKALKGDVNNLSDLGTLLTGKDAVYVNLNLKRSERKNDFHAETDGLKNIIKVAQSTGVKRIAFVSSLVMNYQGNNAFHWWVFDVKRQAIELIKESGIPYTIFYPSTFMENFETTFRMGNNILLAGESKHKMFLISSRDFANQVVRSFEVLKHECKHYPVQGPEGFVADEAARIFVSNHQSKKLRIIKAPFGLLKQLGRFSRQVNYGVHIIEAMNNYPEIFQAEDTWMELGRPQITLRGFAKTAD